VDLGQVRNLDGIGITLDNASSSANAAISLATAQGDWHTLPTAHNIASTLATRCTCTSGLAQA